MRALIPVLLALFLASAPAALAQNPFAPVIRVDDRVITAWEIDQRARFLGALRSPGDLEAEARERLIDERLQVDAARAAGIEVTEAEYQEGLAEFADRASLTSDAFLAALAQEGIAEETVRDFVTAGLAWRAAVQARFAGDVRISSDEIDRAVLASGTGGGVRVLLSEIILPARNPEEAAESEARAEVLSQITGFEAFARAAREFSASTSRDQGGRLDWLSLNALPPGIRAQILTLAPGQVTEPVRVPNAVGVFQLRALEEVAATETEALALDFAEFLPPEGTSAATVLARIDTCDDLFGENFGRPEAALLREVRPISEVPSALSLTLARLDENEAVLFQRDGQTRIVMLCERTRAEQSDESRREVAAQLRNARLSSLAASWLADLRADAVIVGQDG
ncbi:MAG: peptidylprolyl isomerase [Pseudomonadota bacterium]